MGLTDLSKPQTCFPAVPGDLCYCLGQVYKMRAFGWFIYSIWFIGCIVCLLCFDHQIRQYYISIYEIVLLSLIQVKQKVHFFFLSNY